MSIIFLVNHLSHGGVSIVTIKLANRFVSDGHTVCIFAFSKDGHTLTNELDKRVKFVSGAGWHFSIKNIILLRQTFKKYNIKLVVNQWGLPFKTILTARIAGQRLDIKYWSFYHNDPSANGRIQSIENKKNNANSIFTRYFFDVEYWIAKYITSRSMKFTYKLSDKYCLLSNSFVSVFSCFTGIKNPNKIEVLTNPITVDVTGFDYLKRNKELEIIYCGRLDNRQKRVDRIIDAWALLESKYPDWNLTIIGDGIDRSNLELQVSKLYLSRVSFVGFQSPKEYYKKASVLLLTSDFEGFGLVIVEAMQFGVVPIVYGSYVAVNDIIDNGVNGFITPMPYNINDTVVKLCKLMDDKQLREQMAVSAIEKSNTFSMDKIIGKWYSMFKDNK